MAKVKLLTRKDETQKDEMLGVSIKLGRLLPEHVAEMRRMYSSREDAAASIAIYGLRHAVSELTNDGEMMDAVFVSYNLDTADDDVRPFINALAVLITEACLLSDEVKKKSTLQRQLTGQVSGVVDALEDSTAASATAPMNS